MDEKVYVVQSTHTGTLMSAHKTRQSADEERRRLAGLGIDCWVHEVRVES
jgi:hypothetical protein